LLLLEGLETFASFAVAVIVTVGRLAADLRLFFVG
jgi:hypothetical protein